MRAFILMMLVACPGVTLAQDKSFSLAADQRLEVSGLLDYLVPRFSLKYGVRVTVMPSEPDDIGKVLSGGGADAALVAEPITRTLRAEGRAGAARAVFHSKDPRNGGAFSIALVLDSENREHADRFADWLVSDVGQRTVASFEAEGVAYVPGAAETAEVEVELPDGDVAEGERLSHLHCGRCHVVSDRNRFGGIGSTPSFSAMRSIDTWQEKFLNFWDANPHPSFMQVEGITDPFDPGRPPHVAPIEITQDDLAAIVAFAASIMPKDLGAEIELR